MTAARIWKGGSVQAFGVAAGSEPAERIDPIGALREIAFWQERSRAEPHRALAYRRAADALAVLSDDERADLAAAHAWQAVPSVGPKTAQVIEQTLAGQIPDTLAKLREQGVSPLHERAGELRPLLRGDLHLHTDWSDGGAPLAEMVQVAGALGHEYLAITDHSPRLRVANGLDAQRLVRQVTAINQLNGRPGGPVILRGIEVDILQDGSLDQTDVALSELDIVVSSVHSGLRDDSETMTRRMVAAIANPHTNVLGHCTGRLVMGERGTRPESRFDAEVVLTACAEFGVAVEINSRPERQDPPMRLIELALDIGCVFTINTDAHAPGQLDFLDCGCGRAVEAGIPPERIITTWSLDRLQEFLAR